MRIAGWVLLGMLGGLGAAHAQTATAPADDSAALATVRALSTRIYSTTREIEAVHAGRAPAAADLDHRIAELRHEIDALRRRAGDADALATAPLARKTRQLSMLVSNLERAAAILATATLPSLIPAHLPANRRISFAPTTLAAGGSCRDALGFGAGAELYGVLPARGELWLHIDTPADAAIVVHTRASPLDTEIAEFGRRNQDFQDRDAQVLGASTDTQYVHLAWRKDHPDLKTLPFPMLADTKRELSSALGVLHKHDGVPLRATFIVDPQGIIRHVSVNDLSVGRNVDEVLRVLDALQTDELCPCNWKKGEDTLEAA